MQYARSRQRVCRETLRANRLLPVRNQGELRLPEANTKRVREAIDRTLGFPTKNEKRILKEYMANVDYGQMI